MKSLIASIVILGLVGMVVGMVAQAATADVTATVTPRLISVSVDPTSVDYGVMGTSEDQVSPTITVTNDGNDVEDITITGSDSTNWTLSDTVGSETFVHKAYAGTPWPGGDTGAVTLTTSPQTFIEDMATTSQDCLLKIYTPSSTTVTAQQSTTVTLTATYGG